MTNPHTRRLQSVRISTFEKFWQRQAQKVATPVLLKCTCAPALLNRVEFRKGDFFDVLQVNLARGQDRDLGNLYETIARRNPQVW
jgi:hypothetical protein